MSTSQPMGDRIAERFPYHLIALGVVLYGTGPVLARSADTSGVLLSFWRLWFGFGVLVVSAVVQRLSGRSLATPKGLKWAALAGAAFSLNQVFFFTAIKRTSVVDASLMSTLAPIVVGFAAIPMFGERPAPAFRLWSVVAMAGAAFVVLGSSQGPDGDRSVWPWPWSARRSSPCSS
ncbi:MAG: DMT family transporter [Acidimicrobiales bacterium]